MKKSFILLGPPGCGKGTQTKRISEKLNLPHIDTGGLLRKNVQEGTELGVEAKTYMDKGELVPPELVEKIIKARLGEDDCKNGYILDGYPRSVIQAETLERMQKELNYGTENVVIYFDIPTSVLVERLVNRRSCPKCGFIYNLLSIKPKKEGLCDTCDVELVQRKDDTEETAMARFATYNSETAPLLDYFKNSLIKINAEGSVDEVWAQVEAAL